ncbi:MAG: NAD(P)-binding domain-containing protein [Bacteriovorax sp.]|jgi:putative flavoprotein involved in K+ transport
MENCINRKVIIVGAGPAGLSLGYYLQKNNIDYLILEKNTIVGASWTQMPDHLHLISLWSSNCLLKEDLELWPANKAHSAKEFAEYLMGFAKKHRLNCELNASVLEINKVNGQFIVKTQSEQFISEIVVDCRGYFNSPHIPHLNIIGQPPFMMHFKDYKNCGQLSEYKRILIVGKRLSAGQLLCELAYGRHELFLSARSKINYSPRTFILNFFLRHLNFFENIKKRLASNLKIEVEVPMHFKAKKIVEKKVKLRGDILKIENKKVTFMSGGAEEIDAIVFATGFRPQSVRLKDDFESLTDDGLYYLGRGAQRTFTSRFIRGIREDAPILCQLILGKLESRNKLQ